MGSCLSIETANTVRVDLICDLFDTNKPPTDSQDKDKRLPQNTYVTINAPKKGHRLPIDEACTDIRRMMRTKATIDGQFPSYKMFGSADFLLPNTMLVFEGDTMLGMEAGAYTLNKQNELQRLDFGAKLEMTIPQAAKNIRQHLKLTDNVDLNIRIFSPLGPGEVVFNSAMDDGLDQACRTDKKIFCNFNTQIHSAVKNNEPELKSFYGNNRLLFDFIQEWNTKFKDESVEMLYDKFSNGPSCYLTKTDARKGFCNFIEDTIRVYCPEQLSLVIYFGGHCTQDKEGVIFKMNQAYQFSEMYENMLTKLENIDFTDKCRNLNFCFLFECCYAGLAIEKFDQEVQQKLHALAVEKKLKIQFVICTSSSKDQKSFALTQYHTPSKFGKYFLSFTEDQQTFWTKFLNGEYEEPQYGNRSVRFPNRSGVPDIQDFQFYDKKFPFEEKKEEQKQPNPPEEQKEQQKPPNSLEQAKDKPKQPTAAKNENLFKLVQQQQPNPPVQSQVPNPYLKADQLYQKKPATSNEKLLTSWNTMTKFLGYQTTQQIHDKSAESVKKLIPQDLQSLEWVDEMPYDPYGKYSGTVNTAKQPHGFGRFVRDGEYGYIKEGLYLNGSYIPRGYYRHCDLLDTYIEFINDENGFGLSQKKYDATTGELVYHEERRDAKSKWVYHKRW